MQVYARDSCLFTHHGFFMGDIMAVYQLGSKGDEVKQVQQRFKELNLYSSHVDGAFGGGTESAVKLFQQNKNLEADSSVGPITWRALFNQEQPQSQEGVEYKCLALTGSFETGAAIPDCFAGLSGDFDEQGMSFGVAQWNFGQDSLQPLFREMIDNHPDIVKNIFQSNYDVFISVLNSEKAKLMTSIMIWRGSSG
ncbi:MAG: peptidoglycan-binding protein [Deltaproteobacteria bacterium]|nr:peptidoglycan-binding protein [Deltaproteobacteria bacterium]